MAHNRNLRKALKQKQDEFYTQLVDIENELRHYTQHFDGKTVYCNCDDPRVSNFFHYFSYNFERLGLKKLITTCYKNQSPDLFSRHDDERAIMLEYDGFRDGDRVPRLEDIGINRLEGDGDFRSHECIDILKQVDIVVTNPPFSLFREYLAQLIEHGKQFLILGQQNAITYKEVFPLIKDRLLWLGHNNGGDKWFQVPDHYENAAVGHSKWEEGAKYHKHRSINWFTNLDHAKLHDELILYKRYTPEEYQHYENYDAINVDKVAEIPVDWDGVMGVPITFPDKHNPDQFEILGIGIAGLGLAAGVRPFTPEHRDYRRNVQGRGAVDGDLYMIVDGEVKVPYRRILIRRRNSPNGY